jgi:hypothetical protein
VAAGSSARLVTQYPSAIKHTAIERAIGSLFVHGELPPRSESRNQPMDVFLASHAINQLNKLVVGHYAVPGQCCRLEVCDHIPPMGGVSSQQVHLVKRSRALAFLPAGRRLESGMPQASEVLRRLEG